MYERKFNLQYYLGLSFYDSENIPVKELNWTYGRLIKQKQEENKKE